MPTKINYKKLKKIFNFNINKVIVQYSVYYVARKDIL